MKLRFLIAFTSLLLVAACGQRVDKPFAPGDGLGREWTGAPGQERIVVNNRLVREVVVHVDGPGAHYEMTVRSGHLRYIVVPSADYKFSLYYPDGKEVGNNYFWADDTNGAKGLFLDINRP